MNCLSASFLVPSSLLYSGHWSNVMYWALAREPASWHSWCRLFKSERDIVRERKNFLLGQNLMAEPTLHWALSFLLDRMQLPFCKRKVIIFFNVSIFIFLVSTFSVSISVYPFQCIHPLQRCSHFVESVPCWVVTGKSYRAPFPGHPSDD